MTRVGAIDCGTNSIRLLIADVEPGDPDHPDDGPRLAEVSREMEIVRLGHGVDATGRIAPESMERTLAAAWRYAQKCRAAECAQVRFVATSASRDASNAAEFVSGVSQAFDSFGVAPEVVSGDEEARLSFAGATGGQPPDTDGDFLVVDIGGGSTEFVRGRDRVEAAVSMDIGCVRMTERHLHDDPPGEDQIWAALGDITVAVGEAADRVDFSSVGTLIGLAGSVTTVTAHALGLDSYDRAAIHGAEIDTARVIEACSDLVRLPRSERQALGFMHPGRVDVIGAGALIWRTVIQRVAHDAGISTVRASEADILDGIALSLA